MTILSGNSAFREPDDLRSRIAGSSGHFPLGEPEFGKSEHDDQTRRRLVGWANRVWRVSVAEDAPPILLAQPTAASGTEILMMAAWHRFAPPDTVPVRSLLLISGKQEVAGHRPVYAWLRAGASSEISSVPFKRADDPRANASLAWQRLENTVSRWLSLPDDWDGNDGVAPSQKVVDAARAFIKRARVEFTPVPEVYIAGDGEIGFRWRGHDAFASAAFLPDEHIVIYCKIGPESVLRVDEPYSPTLDLSELLDAVSSFG